MNILKRTITTLCSCMLLLNTSITVNAQTALSTPKLVAEKLYDVSPSNETHPTGKQTSQINVMWKKVSGAKKYEVQVKSSSDSRYKKWKTVKTVTATESATQHYKVSNLKRITNYKFRVRAVSDKTKSKYSSTQSINTARMNYSTNDFKAVCQIVYHEVGQSSSNRAWDKPIVLVSDAMINTWVGKQYTKDSRFTGYYKWAKSISDIVYDRGHLGMAWDYNARKSNRDSVYKKIPKKIKNAVYGALYGKTMVGKVANDYYVAYWCNGHTYVRSPHTYNITPAGIRYNIRASYNGQDKVHNNK